MVNKIRAEEEMIDFNLYTVAHGDKFIDCAIKSAETFVEHNENIKYTVFILDNGNEWTFPSDNENIEYKLITDWKSFSPEFIKKKPFADICLFKSAIAPGLLTEPSKYIGFVDADTICNRTLPYGYFEHQLESGKICVATDSKAYQRKHELINRFDDWTLYFNSGVIFYDSSVVKIFTDFFYNWAIKNERFLLTMPFNEQTWLNVFLNSEHKSFLYELGYYWNMRSSVNVPEAHIWHYGRKIAEAGSYE